MATYTKDWFSLNIPHLTNLFSEYKNKEEVKILEIGSFEGRSTVWFLQTLLKGKGSEIVCVDTFEGSAVHSNLDLTNLYDTFSNNIKPWKDKATVYKSKSAEALVLPEVRSKKYDIIYIDGCHRGREVLEDTVLSFDLLKSGGIMLFDDYRMNQSEITESPYGAINSFISLYLPYIAQETIREHGGSGQLSFIKK